MNFDWEKLYSRKAAELILYGRALGLSHGEAEDVLQETFMALMHLEQLPSQPEYYCIRSFRNRALNYKRTLWRRSLRTTVIFTHLFSDGNWFEKSENENDEMMQAAAVNCLAELPQEQREAIVLKIWHRCTFEEIGELLEISPNTAAGRYRYGLQKIKSRLEGENYERERNEFARKEIALMAAAPSFGDA
jgi:RNA polymerase sigma-70 factor (ECF subfamily)